MERFAEIAEWMFWRYIVLPCMEWNHYNDQCNGGHQHIDSKVYNKHVLLITLEKCGFVYISNCKKNFLQTSEIV